MCMRYISYVERFRSNFLLVIDSARDRSYSNEEPARTLAPKRGNSRRCLLLLLLSIFFSFFFRFLERIERRAIFCKIIGDGYWEERRSATIENEKTRYPKAYLSCCESRADLFVYPRTRDYHVDRFC